MTTAVSHVRYLVRDFPPVLHFYRDVLGLKLAVDVPGQLEGLGGYRQRRQLALRHQLIFIGVVLRERERR